MNKSRRFITWVAAIGALGAAAVPASAPASPPHKRLGEITEFAVAPGSRPLAIAPGPDGALWFTQIGGNRIGRMTTDGVLTAEWEIPTPNSQPDGIAIGHDGSVWFAELAGNKIGRLDPDSGTIAEYEVPTPNSRPTEVAVAADGSVWFTERGTPAAPGSSVGRVEPATGVVTEYFVRAGSRPLGIVAGPDGNIWFTESAANRVGRMSPSGVLLAEYELPGANSQPWEPAVGPDGAIWFTEVLANRIGRITMDGALSEFPIPTANSGPNVIVAGPDPTPAHDCAYQRDAHAASFTALYGGFPDAFGRCASMMARSESLWFAQTLANQIARITTSGIVTEFPIPSPATQPVGVAAGPDGNVWFAESAAATGNRIGQLLVP
ncbi:MAG: virginiamycin B lyase family protein [Solirubrobacteraceae bacterium]